MHLPHALQGFSRDGLLTPLFVDPAHVPAFQVRVAAGDSGACVTFYECLLTCLLIQHRCFGPHSVSFCVFVSLYVEPVFLFC